MFLISGLNKKTKNLTLTTSLVKENFWPKTQNIENKVLNTKNIKKEKGKNSSIEKFKTEV